MRVTVTRSDGSRMNGRIIRSEGTSLIVGMRNAARPVEFQFNLGDWISPSGDMISYEWCDQLPGTYLRLMELATHHRMEPDVQSTGRSADWQMPGWIC